ncbi:MAG: 4Fe-4S binding protein [Chloroflexi bacterium]|nr:4Fe-4S binding protein [Chloroflexota bacterium]
MRTVKYIKIDTEKCTGCRLCEAICSASHAEPKFGVVNPHRSRIRILKDAEQNVYYPTFGGPFTDVECLSRSHIKIAGREYGECSFCRASCPSREIYKETGDEPLKCDMCEQVSPGDPLCVKVCLVGALTFAEKQIKEKGEKVATG